MNIIGFTHQCLLHLVAYIFSFIPTRCHKFFDVVIVRVDALGDYVIWHDSIEAYRKRFKGKRVLLICANLVRPLAEQESFFSEIIDFDRRAVKSLFCFYRLMRCMKTINSGILLYPNWERHTIGDAIVCQINSPQKVGMVPYDSSFIITKLYNRQYQKLVRCSFKSEIAAVECFTKSVVSPEYKYGYYMFHIPHQETPVFSSSKYIVVAFSASKTSKSWELEKFVKVIDIIPPMYKVVLTGSGGDDVIRADKIISQVKNKDQIVNLVNKTSVVQLVSLISCSKLVVGNDSAAVHIAAATRVKSICVLLGAHFGRFLPYPNILPLRENTPLCVFKDMNCFNCNYHCIFRDKEPFECLKRVSANIVIDKVNEFLKDELS